MKKTFSTYAIAWAFILAVFNVICFVTPNEFHGYTKFTGAFWVGYVFITLAFIGQLACAFFAFKADSLKKMFYNLPLITVSYTGLVVMLICGGLTMLIPDVPYWVGVIVCVIVLAFTAVAVIKASAASQIIENVDNKVRTQTAFIKQLTSKAEGIGNQAKSDAVKTECRKVFEAIRYSDPMSHPDLSVVEAKITLKMDEFAGAVSENDTEAVSKLAEELILLVKDRNGQCKLLK